MRKIFIVSILLFVANTSWAQVKNYPPAKVSFNDFKNLVMTVEPHRAQRLIDLDTFLKMSKEPNTIIFDSRSDFRFNRIHVKGALHLNFSDFTEANLKKVIPSYDTRILIYCNNNFEGNQVDFASKVGPIRPPSDPVLTSQYAAQEKPLMLALNIPTYVNLYGYGYRNVYELHELVDVSDPRIEFEGSIVKKPGLSDLFNLKK